MVGDIHRQTYPGSDEDDPSDELGRSVCHATFHHTCSSKDMTQYLDSTKVSYVFTSLFNSHRISGDELMNAGRRRCPLLQRNHWIQKLSDSHDANFDSLLSHLAVGSHNGPMIHTRYYRVRYNWWGETKALNARKEDGSSSRKGDRYFPAQTE
ncbi:hypothetical protein PROFUN_09793 [Planoprotostelium fungivorum]|uniref:Uncharacterized protein n=1 Tax=Planoprotostelium fungivorum TaxID=1890364 RepID=A0A2P6NGN6_9EUKA|nr:hypothetical protein PROFUN_09793 [Planoprotostelium fungivorum]